MCLVKKMGLFLVLFFMPWLLNGQDCRDWVVAEFPVVATGPVTMQDTVITQAIRTIGRKKTKEKDFLEVWVYRDERKAIQLFLGRHPKFRDKDLNRLVGLRFSDGTYFRNQGESRFPIPPTAYMEYNYLIQPLTPALSEHLQKHLLLAVDIEIHTRLEPKTHQYFIPQEDAEGLRQSLRCMLNR